MSIPVPKTSVSRKWFNMYMWSDVLNGPDVRSTEHGKVSSVLSYGGSQIFRLVSFGV